MKRLSDFVSGLGRDELLYVERMCQEIYRSFCREIMKEGRDVFVNHIFYWLSQETEFLFMSELRLVCSEWNRMLREITFMRIDNDYYDCSVFKKYQLDQNFPSIQSIRACCTILTNFAEPCKRMKSLEIYQTFEQVCHGSRRSDSYSLEGWNSLTSLRLVRIRRRIKGIERLTSLTELQCEDFVFRKSKDLMNLVNLTSLKIQGFPTQNSFVSFVKLTKLSHLESDYQGHFIGFSGTGIFRTCDDPSFVCSPFDQDSINSINKHFNQHFQQGPQDTKPSLFVYLKGIWDKGIFSGRCFINISQGFGFPTGSYEGVMSEGKLITKKEF